MKKQLLTLALIIGASSAINAQEEQTKKEQTKKEELKNVRSSLHIMIIESDNFPQKEVVLKAFNNAPFPDKYNDHQIGEKSFNPIDYPLTAEEKAIIYTPSKMGKLVSSAAAIQIDSLKRELPYRINKYLAKEKIANELVAKWYNRQADGSFDSELILERGVMGATFVETKTSQASEEGKSLLSNVGKELIPNTFVVINKFNFVENEPVARVIRDVAKNVADSSITVPALLEKAKKGIDAVYEKTKEGYSIWATSYLYKLVWNDSIRQIFYNDFYMDKTDLDPKKKVAFDNSDLFKLEFVGDESATGLILFSLKEKRTEDQIIELSTVRIIDNVYAKLQKKYDVFKTKTPLYTGNPITAKIGTKEGLVGGEKFEVLQPSQVSRVSPVIYKRIGTIKVDKDLIWDNTYNAGEAKDLDPVADGVAPKPVINATTFKGGNKYEEGYYIKQIK